jgi:hypothetical protein
MSDPEDHDGAERSASSPVEGSQDVGVIIGFALLRTGISGSSDQPLVQRLSIPAHQR